jgi:hypothetical protein
MSTSALAGEHTSFRGVYLGMSTANAQRILANSGLSLSNIGLVTRKDGTGVASIGSTNGVVIGMELHNEFFNFESVSSREFVVTLRDHY